MFERLFSHYLLQELILKNKDNIIKFAIRDFSVLKLENIVKYNLSHL